MNKIIFVYNLINLKSILSVLVFVCMLSCSHISDTDSMLRQSDLNHEVYSDSINNIEVNLYLPVISNELKLKILEIIYEDSIETYNSILKHICKDRKNFKSNVVALYENEKALTLRINDLYWTKDGDTLRETSHITYLKHYNRKFSLNDIISNNEEIDLLTTMLNGKGQSILFSPDVDVTISGDSIMFHYEKVKQEKLHIALSLDDIDKHFHKFKTIYNE